MPHTSHLACAASLLALLGCQAAPEVDAGGTSSTVSSAQDSATATAMEASVLSTVIDSIIADNTGAEVDSGGANVQSVPTTTLALHGPATPFTFSESGSLTVDLDAPGSDEPNVIGIIRIDYSGSVAVSVPLHTSGTADYHVTVTWISDGVYADPHCGKSTTVLAGSTWTLDALYDWDWVSDTQWSIAAQTDLAIAEDTPHTASVNQGEALHTVVTHGQRRESAEITRSGDIYTIDHSIVADWYSQISGSSGDHSVHWDRDGLDTIRITVDGITYGPYTRAQIVASWDCTLH